MRLREAIPGLLCSLFGLVFAIATAMNPLLSARSTTSDGVPGAGFFPYLMSGICIFLGVVLAVRGMRSDNAVAAIDPAESRRNRKKLWLCVLGIVVFMLVWMVAEQFMIGSFALCLYLNWLFERGWKFNVIYACLFTAFIYLVFSLGFSIQFVA